MSEELKKDENNPCSKLRDSCSRENCNTKCSSFADNFVLIFGGEEALELR